MKSKYFILTILGAIFFVVAVILAIHEFIILAPGEGYLTINKTADMQLTGLDGKVIDFPVLVNRDLDTFCLFFEPGKDNGAFSRALEEMEKIRNQGKAYILVGIHDSLDEVSSYYSQFDYPLDALYQIDRLDFYRNILCPALPLLVVINNGVVIRYKYFNYEAVSLEKQDRAPGFVSFMAFML